MRRTYHRIRFILFAITFATLIPIGFSPGGIESVSAVEKIRRPNVVLVMTDDQGYGDLGCHGNTIIKTPNMDALYAKSIRLTNYHVDPTCSPTRSALLTGRYSSRTGVWHTIMGRSILHKDEVTMADVFAQGGYRTAAFGKWHLGDNYPFRPQDRGFQEILMHGGGGVSQTPDYWGNNYFDDTYWHNGVPKKYSGYCTDVFFDGAMQFIEANKDRPFFVYLPTNAAHSPFLVDKKYSEPYKKLGVPSPRAEFYGMITNIDDNMARLEKKLAELELTDNTIFIFTTDNGTAAGMRDKNGYNAGMRGTKGSEYDGGHRVPFFIHWPKGNMTGGKDIDSVTAHIDILPTLIELCHLKSPADVDIDGRSLVPLLTGKGNWLPRTLFVHSQRLEFPKKWRKAAVMTDQWRLVVDGKRRELFNMLDDPGQTKNVAGRYPDLFARLATAYENWYEHVSDRFEGYVRSELGSPKANPTPLTCHDWHTNNKPVPWNHGHIRRDLKANGFWAVDVVRDGRYRFTLRTRPAYVGHPLEANVARITIGGFDIKQSVKANTTEANFVVDLKAGPAKLQTWLENADGSSRGAYFVDVAYVDGKQ